MSFKIKSKPSIPLILSTILWIFYFGFCTGATYANGVLTGGAGG